MLANMSVIEHACNHGPSNIVIHTGHRGEPNHANRAGAAPTRLGNEILLAMDDQKGLSEKSLASEKKTAIKQNGFWTKRENSTLVERTLRNSAQFPSTQFIFPFPVYSVSLPASHGLDFLDCLSRISVVKERIG